MRKMDHLTANQRHFLTFFGINLGDTWAMMSLLKNAIGAGPPWVVLYVLALKMMEGVGEKLRCVIKCALTNFHEVLLKR